MTKKMIVCGDSYMTPAVAHPNTHFAELTAKVLDYELIVYSRGGMSNLGICLQIEEAVSNKPDLILFNTTSYDRTEIPLKPPSEECYDYTMQDIIYRERNSFSTYSGITGKKGPNLISDSMYSILTYNLYDDIPDIDYKTEGIKKYFETIYDFGWERIKDMMCLYASIHKLHESKIPYVYNFPENEILEYCPFIDEKFTLLDKANDLPVGVKDPGYHTTIESQYLMSRMLIDYLVERFK